MSTRRVLAKYSYEKQTVSSNYLWLVSKKIFFYEKQTVRSNHLWLVMDFLACFHLKVNCFGESATICEKRTNKLPSKALNTAFTIQLLTGIRTPKDRSKLNLSPVNKASYYFIFLNDIPAVQIVMLVFIYLNTICRKL